MRHLGDITKINGAEIEIVDVITGGSPCQDLSIAGKRAGLAGARSGLFMEQVRIVKEMREHDRANGRTGDMVRPRFMVWENVPGAFSSNKGRDFAAVLEEIIRIAEPEAPDIEVPEKGWPTWGGYHDEVGGRWSVAWRVHDAQHWGVPQRRRRISVVADFGGDTAGEILFERKSVSRNPAESGTAGERLAETAEAGASYAVRIRGGCDGGGKGTLVQEDKSGTLGAGNDQTIFTPTPINLMVATRCEALGRGTGFGIGEPGDPANTISAAHSHGVFATAIPINDKATRWQGGGESRNHDGSGNGLGIGKEGDPSPTLTAGDLHGVMCMTPWDAQSQRVYDGNGVSPTLSSRENSGLNREAVLCAGFKAGQGAQAGGIGYGEEVSPTLAAVPSGTNRTPAVVAYSFDSLSSNSMKSKNPHSGCREVDVAKTLDTTDPTPSKNQGGIAVVCAGFKLGNSEHTRSIGYAEEQAPTLNAECGGNKPAVMCLNDQGGNVMGVSHDVSGTLRAQEHGHQPAVIAFAQNQREEVRNVGDKAVSLAAEVGMHCQTFVALDMSHACDVIRDCGEVAPSLQARMGTGGNQIPLTYQDVTGTLSPGAHAGSYNGQDAYNDMLVCGATPDVARSILYQPKSAMEENWAASETKNALRAGESKVSHAVMCEDVSHALRANGACAYREDAETYPVQNMVVRRLTPMECERLQGFPDGWTDIGEWRDSKGKLRKPSDSPRYKALGNSIALPFWDFLAKRISAQYIRPVTMGSLFDGIGGFPLVFERHNGKGTARWASEIEEFPIAVTKLRFGGEDNGSQEVLLAEAEA